MFSEEHREEDQVYENNSFSFLLNLPVIHYKFFNKINYSIYYLSDNYYVIYINSRISDKC